MTKKRYQPILVTIALLLVFGLRPPKEAFGQAEQPSPTFTGTACDLPAVSPEILPRLRCGTVAVPRDYENPSAGHFKLAVVIVSSVQQPALPDAVVYISGGPGDPLTIYADYQARHPYASDRNLILVDQRGTGRSEPRLCPDLNSKLLMGNIAVATDMTGDNLTRRLVTYMACRNEALAHGIALSDFGTPTTAEDFDLVRRALGIARWNVFGESYGTTVAMTLVAKYPASVRSVVLDSVYPPDPIPPRASIASSALKAFFDVCAQDKRCSTSFPTLAKTFNATLDQLGRNPLMVAVPPTMHMAGDRARLTASLFQVVIDNLIYYPPAYPSLPRLIAAVHDGDTRDLGAVLASLLADGARLDIADDTAVECRDRPHLRAPAATGATIPDQLSFSGVCKRWSALGPSPVLPIGTAVPTLVMEGQFDPVVGPALGHQVADAIGTHARFVEFPLLGHNVRHFSPCAAAIVARFIAHPAETLDTSCASRRPPIHFVATSPTP